jgi:hypothetical protein
MIPGIASGEKIVEQAVKRLLGQAGIREGC